MTNNFSHRLPAVLCHALGILLTASCFMGNAQALGVMEAQLRSYLNEPLEIEIPIMLTRREQNSNITIQQVQNLNPNIAEWVPILEFELLSHSDGQYSIIATTEQSVAEPIVHFTLSIDTGYHWVKRDMSFLLDPKPIQALNQQRLRPIQPKVVLKPSEARPAPASASRPSVVAPRVEVSTDSNRYTIQNGDSLSLIAAKFNDSRNATLDQAMVAIFSANQRAFINNDVNKIMSHFEIVIPDEQQMTQISAAEARQVFAELMSGAEIRYVQTTPPAAPAAPETTATPAVPPQPVPTTAPVPVPVPELEPVTSQPPAEAEALPATPAPKPEIVSEPETEQANAEQILELTLSNEDKDLSQSIIERNEGTLVFETPEAAAVKAASPSPEVKAAMQSAVNDMEAQLSTLRDEVKKLRQTLQGKEKLLALRSEPRLHSLPQAPAAGTGGQPAATTTVTPPTSKPVPVELETTVESDEDKGPGLLRTLVEILTLGAAGAFIGYFLAYRRKQKVTEDEELATTSRFNPFAMFSRKESEEEEYIYEEEDDEEKPEPRPKHILEEDGRKHEIQVDEEAYDDSIDFTHTEMPEVPAQTQNRTDESEEDDINPDYILQEANLSIAFGDLTAAYEALFKLVNRFPQNTAYRLAMLRALKGLSREEEFIYHANHLAKLTGQDPDSEWQQALQWGHEFLPEHPLFESAQLDATATGPTADTERKTLDDAAAKAQSTVVMDTRKALAEYEQKLRAHEEAKLSGRLPLAAEPTEDEDDMDKTQAREIITLDLGEEAAQVNSPFKLDLQQPHAGIEADSASELSVDDDKTRAVYEEVKSRSITHDEELTAVVHDHAPITAEDSMLDLNELMDDDTSSASPAEQPHDRQPAPSERELADRDAGHIIEFDHEPAAPLVEPQPQIPATDTAGGQPAAGPAPSDLDDLSAEALASMAEFGMVEGIQIDEDILRRLHESEHGKSDSEPEESDDVEDDTAFVKRD